MLPVADTVSAMRARHTRPVADVRRRRRTPAVTQPLRAPAHAYRPLGAPQTRTSILHLQKTAGNAAVTSLLRDQQQRVGLVRPVQRSLWGAIKGAASGIWGGVKRAASAAWGGITGVASSVWEGAKSLGRSAWNWLKSAGSHVWNAIKWFGSKSWTVIKVIGSWGWEKLALLGSLAWSFISNLPERFWRIVVDAWHGMTGVLGWLWTGLKGVAGGAWDAVTGVFGWLASGLGGALRWLGNGLARGAAWVVDFASHPSFDKLRDGLLGGLSWVWDGIKGFGQWGWNGLVAAAKWAWSGIKAFGKWLWDGVLGGLSWCGRVLLHLLELFGLGEALQLLWGLIFRLRPLTEAERAASASVHPAGLIPYWQVRVDDDSYLIKIGTALANLFKTKVSPGAITTMHVVHAPAGGLSMPLAVHELTHVGQYEKIGAIYMPQALHAQGSTAGYDYGNLANARAAGRRFADFNREQQASICEDYYKVRNGGPAEFGATEAELAPFIADMRAGRF